MENFSTLIENSKRAVRYWWLLLIIGIALFSLYGCIQSKAHYCHIGMFHGQLYLLRGTHSHFSAPLRSVPIMCHSLYL